MSTDKPGCWLRELAVTDEEEAQLFVEVKRLENAIKEAKAAVFQISTGNIEERKARSELNEDVQDYTRRWLESLQTHRALHNTRQTLIMKIEAWRTLEASRRQGNVT